jgi:iron(III) transport system substrate-binding protein
MKKISILALYDFICINIAFAAEVNVFSARHYDSDIQLYEKFTKKTGIKVNVVSGKDKALQKRIMKKEQTSKADIYITADAGRLGAFDAKGMFQNFMTSTIKLLFQKTLDLKVDWNS